MQSGIVDVFIVLASTNPGLYTQVIEYYLSLGDPLQLPSYLLVDYLVKIGGREAALGLLSKPGYIKHRWLFHFYACLADAQIKREDIGDICTLYTHAKAADLSQSWDYLLKYCHFDQTLFVRVVSAVLERIEEDETFAYTLDWLFNPYTEVNKTITELFVTDIDLLKRLYLVNLERDQHSDNDGHTLSRILDVAPNFLIEYIDWMYGRKKWLNHFDDTRGYSFLWMRSDYSKIMISVVEHIYQKEQERESYFGTYIETFFALRENSKENATVVQQRQDELLGRLIEERYNDSKFMMFLFGLIAQFSPERRRQYIALFLHCNKVFEDFKELSLEPSSWNFNGSLVPVLQGRIEYFESLLPMLNTVELLQHKQFIEEHIQSLRKEIEWAKKRDFMED
jgi:hypothetical protein